MLYTVYGEFVCLGILGQWVNSDTRDMQHVNWTCLRGVQMCSRKNEGVIN